MRPQTFFPIHPPAPSPTSLSRPYLPAPSSSPYCRVCCVSPGVAFVGHCACIRPAFGVPCVACRAWSLFAHLRPLGAYDTVHGKHGLAHWLLARAQIAHPLRPVDLCATWPRLSQCTMPSQCPRKRFGSFIIFTASLML